MRISDWSSDVCSSDLCVLALLAPGDAVRAELRGHGGFVTGIAVTPQGDRAVSASFDYSLILWNLENQEALEVLDDHERAVNAVALVDGCRHALSARGHGPVRVWDLEGGGSLPHEFYGAPAKAAGVADVKYAEGRVRLTKDRSRRQ